MYINKKKIYIISIIGSLLLVQMFFAIQVLVFFKQLHIEYFILPTLLGILVGIIIAKVMITNKLKDYKIAIFHSVVDESKNIFSYFKSTKYQYEYISPSIYNITGYERDEFCTNDSHLDNIIYKDDKKIWNTHLNLIKNNNHKEYDIEIRIVTKEGNILWIKHSVSPVYVNDIKIGNKFINTDITRIKTAELKVTSLSNYDNLTQIPNRQFLINKTEKLIEQNVNFAFFLINLKRFKKINHNMNSKVGDNILKQVSAKLKIFENKDVFIARLGGDEFAVLLGNIKTKQCTLDFANKLSSSIVNDYIVEDSTLHIGASIGVSLFPFDTLNRQKLLSYANMAMLKSKDVNLANLTYYDTLNKLVKNNDLIIEQDLRLAIKDEKLIVFMQPKYNFRTKKIVSFEALIRWQHNDTMIYPDTFIPIAEETGLIRKITEFVIKECFLTSSKWHKQGKEYKIAINLSPIDFMSDNLLDFLEESLKTYNVKASWFDLEITENIFLEDDISIQSKIQKIIDLGFGLALDDFGTGYSSLIYLTRYPLTCLKIDKAFVDNLSENYTKNISLLKAMLDLSHDLNLEVVVEGVETNTQLDILSSMQSCVVQGYLFYKPMPVSEIEKIIDIK